MAHIKVVRRSMRPEEWIDLRFGWLKRLIFKEKIEIDTFTIREARQVSEMNFEFYDETPKPLKKGDMYFTPDGTAFIEAEAQIPEKYKGDFVISSRGQSAFDIIGQWITNHTYITESTTIESLPIYNLDVNQVIIVDGEQYFIVKITLPLSYNSTMSINAIKAPKTLDKKE